MSADGTIEQTADTIVFRYERHLRHPVEAVWKALVDPREMEAWFGIRVELQPTAGGDYVTYHGHGHRVVDRVVAIEPPRLFEHTFWVETNPSALVRWELRPVEGGCLLTLTHTMSTEDVRRAAAGVAAGDSFATIISRNGAGWHHHLDRLEALLGGRRFERSDADMKTLRDCYAAIVP